MAKRKRSTRTVPRPNPTAPGAAIDGPTTKAERRDQARQERHALQRKMERRRRLRGLTTRVVVVLAVLGVAGGVLLLTRSRSPKTGPVEVSGAPSVDPTTLPGVLTGPAPWPANTEDLEARLSAIGLPALSAEGTELHIHQHLDLYVNGTSRSFRRRSGSSPARRWCSPLSTRTTRAESSTSSRPPSGLSRWVSSSMCGGSDSHRRASAATAHRATGPCGCTLTASSRRETRRRSSCSPTRRSSSRTERRPSSPTPSRRAIHFHRAYDHDVVGDQGGKAWTPIG